MLRFSKFFILMCLLVIYKTLIFAQDISVCQSNISDPVISPEAIKWPDNRNKQQLDKNFWLTMNEISKKQPDNIILVDVRSGIKEKISGLNMLTIPLNQISEARFLMDKNVILVGSGFDQIQINQTINYLRKKGFKRIFALTGGIYAWDNQQKSVSLRQQEISPEEFLSGGKTIHWQIISIGLNTKQVSALPEQPVKQFAFTQNTVSELNQFMQKKFTNKDTFIHYVLVGANEQDIKLLQQQIKLSKSANITWLRGGIIAYQHYVQQQTNLINHTGKSLYRSCRLNI
ncbi:Rhodanese-related sulfurtransferase [Snodgrassella alvi SCGC AB-598-P14]|nr:Rhodanese-related sulfurtransferase [Snodgrassella alvi SCGC AB-598-P14]